MKALITGGAGFIGYHLCNELLKNGYEVILTDNFQRGVRDSFLNDLAKSSHIEIQEADLLDRDSFDKFPEDIDVIFHLAAIIGVRNVLEHPAEVLKNNILLLFHAIEYAKRQKHLKRFVYTSTSEVYAGTLKYYDMKIPTPEDTPLAITPLEHPRTSYMLSKIYGEAVLTQSGVPFTIVRPHNFYGPRMGLSHVIPELLYKVYFNKGGGKLEVFSPNHQRTFCYISDAVIMMRLLAESPDSINETFNIGNEYPETSIREVALEVLKAVGRQYVINEKTDSAGSPKRRCPDMTRTKNCINYEPQIPLAEGIRRTYGWYRDNIFEGNEKGAR